MRKRLAGGCCVAAVLACFLTLDLRDGLRLYFAYPSLPKCRDGLGTVDNEHGPLCYKGIDCKAIGTGTAASIGAIPSNDCICLNQRSGWVFIDSLGVHFFIREKNCIAASHDSPDAKDVADECFPVWNANNDEGRYE